jgi:hypothetical protein
MVARDGFTPVPCVGHTAALASLARKEVGRKTWQAGDAASPESLGRCYLYHVTLWQIPVPVANGRPLSSCCCYCCISGVSPGSV